MGSRYCFLSLVSKCFALHWSSHCFGRFFVTKWFRPSRGSNLRANALCVRIICSNHSTTGMSCMFSDIMTWYIRSHFPQIRVFQSLKFWKSLQLLQKRTDTRHTQRTCVLHGNGAHCQFSACESEFKVRISLICYTSHWRQTAVSEIFQYKLNEQKETL